MIGYARVSTTGQSLEAQREDLRAAGCVAVFCETASGGRGDRPELAKAVAALPHGGVLLVTRLDRFGRRLNDIWRMVSEIEKRGAALRSLSEPWMDTSQSFGRLGLSVLGWAAEMERAAILERTAQGLARAKKNGKRLGARPKLNDQQRAEALRLYYEEQWTFTRIAELVGTDRRTVARYISGVPEPTRTGADGGGQTAVSAKRRGRSRASQARPVAA